MASRKYVYNKEFLSIELRKIFDSSYPSQWEYNVYNRFMYVGKGINDSFSSIISFEKTGDIQCFDETHVVLIENLIRHYLGRYRPFFWNKPNKPENIDNIDIHREGDLIIVKFNISESGKKNAWGHRFAKVIHDIEEDEEYMRTLENK